MKIGEIKIHTLVLMNLCNENQFTLEKYNKYLNETKYNRFLVNMDEPIKRAIDIINSREILKEKSVKLSTLTYTPVDSGIHLELNQITDLYKVKKVIAIKNGIVDLNYTIFSNNLYIHSNLIDKIYLVYYPKIEIQNFALDTEIDLPDNLARLIPYFVKYELYQEDEPNLALLAKNDFENLIESYRQKEYDTTSEIEKIYEV